jgi:hypothetical protein
MGVGEGDPLKANIAINNRVTLPGIQARRPQHRGAFRGHSATVQLRGHAHPRHLRLRTVQKLRGQNRLPGPRDYPVQADKYQYRGKGEKIPIVIEDTKPYLYAKATWADNREVPIKVILDTGAGHALSLDIGSHEHIQLPDKIIRAQLGRGLNGIITGSLGRLEKVKIGSYELQDVITSSPTPTRWPPRLPANSTGRATSAANCSSGLPW